ncbi:kelch-like protein 3 [Montipora foliosa]|uniref:kelch-like protein 3 n=1 Tax=Montipora foliosa TaxID=591990 RepID=UPI0035F14ABF
MAAVSHTMSSDPKQHCEELVERIDALRRSERFCDVSVAVKEEEFKAHKLVLAASSPFFLSLLESDMKESKEHLIKIELEEATAAVIEQVIAYIYTGNVSLTEENSHDLIATADYLLLPGLKALAGEFLKMNLTTENCVFNYYFAEKYQSFGLMEESCKMINANFSEVMGTTDFLGLDITQMLSWVSSDDVIVAAEEEIFKGILKWVRHNRSEREESFPKLLHQVRLTSISREFLLNELLGEELVKTNLDCVNFVLEYLKLILNGNGESYTKPARKCLERNENVIFVCGGQKVLCYYPSENKWCELMDTSLEHRDHSIIQYRDRVYIFSKQGAESNQPHLTEYYMPTINSWGAIQTKFQHREEFSSLFVLNGHSSLYVLTNTETAPENTIYTYNLDENMWDILDNILDRWGACGVADAHYIYIIGGTHNDTKNITATTKVEKIKPGENVWEELAPMIKARHNAFGAAMNGKIYVAGGMQENGHMYTVLSTCEVYNPSTNEWQILPSLNVPRHSASMVCFKGALYVVGGSKSSHKSKELSVEMYDSGENKWQMESAIPVSDEELRKGNGVLYKACIARVHKQLDTKAI